MMRMLCFAFLGANVVIWVLRLRDKGEIINFNLIAILVLCFGLANF